MLYLYTLMCCTAILQCAHLKYCHAILPCSMIAFLSCCTAMMSESRAVLPHRRQRPLCTCGARRPTPSTLRRIATGGWSCSSASRSASRRAGCAAQRRHSPWCAAACACFCPVRCVATWLERSQLYVCLFCVASKGVVFSTFKEAVGRG